jgi:hypothetical protein
VVKRVRGVENKGSGVTDRAGVPEVDDLDRVRGVVIEDVGGGDVQMPHILVVDLSHRLTDVSPQLCERVSVILLKSNGHGVRK